MTLSLKDRCRSQGTAEVDFQDPTPQHIGPDLLNGPTLLMMAVTAASPLQGLTDGSIDLKRRVAPLGMC